MKMSEPIRLAAAKRISGHPTHKYRSPTGSKGKPSSKKNRQLAYDSMRDEWNTSAMTRKKHGDGKVASVGIKSQNAMYKKHFGL